VKHKEHSHDEGAWRCPLDRRGRKGENYADIVIALGAQTKHKRGEGQQSTAYINRSQASDLDSSAKKGPSFICELRESS
jgi:hypothetical protein